MKKTVLFLTVLLISILPVFFSADAHTEVISEKWIKKVKLKKNAITNGFKITHRSDKIYFEAVKVTDPLTKKLVEGEQQLEYRCKESNDVKTITLTFSEGNSASIPVSCLDVIRAELIIMK